MDDVIERWRERWRRASLEGVESAKERREKAVNKGISKKSEG
jgi:hypothetical protein